MSLRPARRVDKYMGWVRQAVLEVGDLSACPALELKDPRFMDVVPRFADDISFHSPLKQINEARRRGLEVDEDDA
jgi:hypothetical protein